MTQITLPVGLSFVNRQVARNSPFFDKIVALRKLACENQIDAEQDPNACILFGMISNP